MSKKLTIIFISDILTMVRRLKKINLGIVLIILTLLGAVGYLVYEKNSKKGDTDKVKTFINDYFKIYNKYALLYEEDRDIDKIIDKSKYDKYKTEMKQELDKYLIDDEALKEKIYDGYIKRIDEQIEGKYIYNKDEKSIYEEKKSGIEIYDMNKPIGIIYYKDYMIVYLIIKDDVNKVTRISDVFNKETGKYEGDTKSQVGIGYTIEHVVLKEIKGEFKVVVHSIINNIRYTFENQNNNGMIVL